MSTEPRSDAVASLRFLDVSGQPLRVPDFFIVGHQKCGTTALYQMLREHPQICMSAVKEPRYFVPELFPPGRELNTLAGYLSLFAGASPHQLVGDASPQYIRSPTAPQAIADMQPDARVVAVLREPASFLRSFHLQMLHRDLETERSLRKALALEPARRAGKRIPKKCAVNPEPLLYSDHVRYVEQLRRFHAAFKPEQVLVLIYEDFRADNAATVRALLRFLALDDTVPVATAETKPLKAVRVQPLMRVADRARIARYDPAKAGALGRTVNALTPKPLRSPAVRAKWRSVVFKRPDPPDARLMAELRRRFKPEVEALSEYLGRDMVGEWGYEHIH
ncbi:MAG TPA: sulfotransferase [Solirubrobacteraceae bacterium]|nr:sulfotransferase [Solirubrobacteraceae bacterium]